MKKDDVAGFSLLGGFAALVIGAWALTTWMPGTQVTECSIGAYGPYAKVRVSSSLTERLIDGSQGRDIAVEFRYSGRLYGSGSRRVTVPRFGTVTTATAPEPPYRLAKAPADPSKLTCALFDMTDYRD